MLEEGDAIAWKEAFYGVVKRKEEMQEFAAAKLSASCAQVAAQEALTSALRPRWAGIERKESAEHTERPCGGKSFAASIS